MEPEVHVHNRRGVDWTCWPNCPDKIEDQVVGFGDLDFEHGETGPRLGSDEVMLWLLICELEPKSRIAGMLYAGPKQCVSEDRAQYR